ncbi:MAG: hypothetical protein IKQ31_00905 [Clostridia bacterium]|nr:hypothetical protein [Clostridia bacterium]
MELDGVTIALVCVSAVLFIVCVLWVARETKLRIEKKHRQVEKVVVKHGARYTRSQEVITEQGDVKASLNRGDFVLGKNRKYRVGKNYDLLPGKYTILSPDENQDKINIRISDTVREYKHNSSIVLSDGDIISAVSSGIVLR